MMHFFLSAPALHSSMQSDFSPRPLPLLFPVLQFVLHLVRLREREEENNAEGTWNDQREVK